MTVLPRGPVEDDPWLPGPRGTRLPLGRGPGPHLVKQKRSEFLVPTGPPLKAGANEPLPMRHNPFRTPTAEHVGPPLHRPAPHHHGHAHHGQPRIGSAWVLVRVLGRALQGPVPRTVVAYHWAPTPAAAPAAAPATHRLHRGVGSSRCGFPAAPPQPLATSPPEQKPKNFCLPESRWQQRSRWLWLFCAVWQRFRDLRENRRRSVLLRQVGR